MAIIDYGIRVLDGLVSAPTLAFLNDIDSGWYLAADGEPRLAVAGVDALSFDGANATFVNTVTAISFIGALIGNASTATALETARNIGGVSFNGTAAIVPKTIQVVDSTDATSSIAMFDSATGNLQPKTDAGLVYDATTATLKINEITAGRGTGSIATNTAFGFEALLSNTTGNSNSAFGYRALRANTDKSFNTAIGRDALLASTGGSSNVAIGAFALDAITSGKESVAVGIGTLGSTTIGGASVAIGHQALQNSTTVNSNVAVGWMALRNNIGGKENTAIGTRALEGNWTGENNVAVGDSALKTSQAASDNTAIGRFALIINTTGFNNVAVGSSAMSNNTTGKQNVAVGFQALASARADDNVAVGWQAMLNTSTGFGNTAVGTTALLRNTEGAVNTAVGQNALSQNTTGDNNSAFGQEALALATIANRNTALGYMASRNNTEGERNTAVGYRALHANVTGTRNIAIGSQAALYSDSSNELFIDAFDRSTAAGERGGSIIYGQMSATMGDQILTVNAKLIVVKDLEVTGSITGASFTGPVTGNADTATLAATVTVIDSTDATSFIAMFDAATGSLPVKTDGGLTYNATSGLLTATGLAGPLNGTVGATTPAAGSFAALSASSTLAIAGVTTLSEDLIFDLAGANFAIGTAALATNATDGFIYISTSAGAPTGVPTTFTGRTALHFDSTNDILYVYDGGWLDPSVGSAGDITAVNITAGIGLIGDQNTASGDHDQTIDFDATSLTALASGLLATDHIVVSDSTVSKKALISGIDLGIFNNDQGWTANAGTVTDVTGGVGIDSTGGATPDITLNLSELTELASGLAGTDHIAVSDAGVSKRALVSGVSLSIFNNDLTEFAVSKLADGTARQLLQTDAAGTGVEWASNIDVPGTLDVVGAVVLDSTLAVVGNVDINGGTIDGTVIGGSVAAAGSFTTLGASSLITASAGVKFGTTVTLTEGSANHLDLASGDNLNIVSGALKFAGSTVIGSTQNLVLSGTGPHAFGGAASGYRGFRVTGAFTSDGSQIRAIGVEFSQNLTGADGDTSTLALFRVGDGTHSVVTQGATESILAVATIIFSEPKITNNLGGGGTIAIAASCYITGAPTEGVINAGLYLSSGDIMSAGGMFTFKEITTPPAVTDWGRIYTKTDDKLYFQDGAGAEHEIAFV